MDLVKTIPLALFLSVAWAQSLSLTIGNAVAGQNYATKSAQFVFRVNGCADFSNARLTASAEGIVNGARRSVKLNPGPVENQRGVYVIGDRWNTDGTWVVAIAATCEGETAGAIVPITATSFVREGTQLFSRAPKPAEIVLALEAYASPVSRPH